jgi:hypothetical protein
VVDRDSVIGKGTSYGLDGPETSPGGGEFSAPVQTDPGAYPTSNTMSTVSFPGVKWTGSSFDHPSSSRSEVKK